VDVPADARDVKPPRVKLDKERLRRGALTFVAHGFVAALVAAPIAAERALEGAHFEDRLGTLPVEISLAHNGVSTLDTGILGSIYWERTGFAGLGAHIRATGPPEAGGSLASYVSPRFIEANAQLLGEPGEVARVYGAELRDDLLRRFWYIELATFLIGGAALSALFRGGSPLASIPTGGRRAAVGTLVVASGMVTSSLVAVQLFTSWDGDAEVTRSYPMSGIDDLSFSNPQALEIAEQVQPFIVKNTDRIKARADEFEAAADASFRAVLPEHANELEPRDGETIVIAEADPQGSQVGTRVRTAMYPLLVQTLGEDAFAMRTISGDISSNGTVAEAGFVQEESEASGDITTVAVKGDHDTDTTVDQLQDSDVVMPDFEVTDVSDLAVVSANDPAFKTLFGGSVVNTTGITETELGENLREKIDEDHDGAAIVLFHQPRSAAGYMGIRSTAQLDEGRGNERAPWDDGIADLPPGAINIGHLHDVEGPWVVWNTDGEQVTWTVVSQLGTSGGVEENPTFNRFSTPFSTPLKKMSMRLQYVNEATGLHTGYVEIEVSPDGTVTIGDRVDIGLPGGEPVPVDEFDLEGESD
jgi:Icc-related predicted phosphoesterase